MNGKHSRKHKKRAPVIGIGWNCNWEESQNIEMLQAMPYATMLISQFGGDEYDTGSCLGFAPVHRTGPGNTVTQRDWQVPSPAPRLDCRSLMRLNETIDETIFWNQTVGNMRIIDASLMHHVTSIQALRSLLVAASHSVIGTSCWKMLMDKESTDFVKLEPWGVPCDNQWAKDCMTLMDFHRRTFIDFYGFCSKVQWVLEMSCARTILGSGRATPFYTYELLIRKTILAIEWVWSELVWPF